jgi:hypothetical protein
MAFGIQTYKGKFLNEVDKAAADQLAPLYTLDLMMGLGPQTGKPAAGIWIYRATAGGDEDLLSFDDARIRAYYDRMRESGGVAEEQVGDPVRIYGEGNFLANCEAALRSQLAKYNYNCDVKVKAAKLKIQVHVPKNEVLKQLGDGTFERLLRKVHGALVEGYQWDPWLGGARRGEIGAEQHRKAGGRALGRQYRHNNRDRR